MPSTSSMFLTLGQATHLPISLLWCTYRAFSCMGLPNNVFAGIFVNFVCFLLPSYNYRKQLIGGWFVDWQKEAPPKYASGLEQLRNVAILLLYAEYMTSAMHWIYRETAPSTIISWTYPQAQNWLSEGFRRIDSSTPSFIYDASVVRVGLLTSIGYLSLYGGLAGVLGNAITEIQQFWKNWKRAAQDLDMAKARQEQRRHQQSGGL